MNDLERVAKRRNEAKAAKEEIMPVFVALQAKQAKLRNVAALASRNAKWDDYRQFEADAMALQPEIDELSAQISALLNEETALKAKETALKAEAGRALGIMNEHILRNLAFCVRGPDFVEADIARERARWAEIMG
jgi:chromosome segregation ATPase